MKRLIIFSSLLMLLGTLGAFAQSSPNSPVFGWDVITIPDFPTNDVISLSASTDVNPFPVIPGYNSQNSLQVHISYGGTGYSFIGATFTEPISIPQLCDFVVKSTNGNNFNVSPLIEYQGVWYLPSSNKTNLFNGWYKVRNQDWVDITNNNPFPGGTISIQNCILYFNAYGSDITLNLDTWFHPTPMLYDGFGDIISGLENLDGLTPTSYSLSQNYPNPFNPSTKIKFTVPSTDFVNLSVYNTLGQKVAELVNGELAAGTYEYEFTGTNLPSGIYFYTLTAKNYSQTMKMALLK